MCLLPLRSFPGNILFTYNHTSSDDTHYNINTWWHGIDLCTPTFWVHYLTFPQRPLASTTTDPLTPSLHAGWRLPPREPCQRAHPLAPRARDATTRCWVRLHAVPTVP